MRARPALVLAAITLVLVVADVVVTAQYRSLLSEDAVAVHGFPFVSLAVLGCAVLGALILTRHPRHPIGLLFVLVGFTSAVSLLAEAYSVWVSSGNGPGPHSLGGVAGWLSVLFGGQIAIGGIALMFLLAPDGHLVSRRWRWSVVVTVLGMALCMLAMFFQDPTTYDIDASPEDPGPIPALMFSLGFLLISIGLLASVVSMVVRLNRSGGVVRQQVRLIAVSAALVASGLVAMLVVQSFNGGRQTWAAAMPLFLSYMLLPVLFGVTVLRYRLYDVEVILNRTLVLVLGTAFAAIGYTTLVVAIGNQVDRGTSGIWVSLLATALVALAFQPLRRQVTRLANRLAFGSRAQPYEALSDFSHRIAETPSPDILLPAVADAAGRAIAADGTAVVLQVLSGPDVSAAWGTPGPDAEAHTVPVRHGRDELGTIQVWLRPGMSLHASDRRLLEALADLTAVVFRNVALQARLAAHVAELDRTTDDLARSRVRIIAADDAARRTMESAISRDVLPHLATVPAAIARARQANAAGMPDTGLDELVRDTNTALESLRALTRGLFPTQLSRSGLEPALRSFLARGGLAGALRLDAAVAGRRFAGPVEAAAYSCVVGTVREFEDLSDIDLSLHEHDLVIRVDGARRPDGDLQAILDRAEAVGGSMTTAPDGLVLRIPVESAFAVSADGRGPDL